MKKIDYYAQPQQWGMPKWVGYALGGLFAVIALGCIVVIVNLTRATTPPAPPVVAVAAPVVAPEPAAAPAQAAPIAAAQSDDQPAPAKATRSAHLSKRAKRLAKKHGRHTMLAKASAKKAPALDDGKARAILAKRETRQSRKAKDDLDKLLGL